MYGIEYRGRAGWLCTKTASLVVSRQNDTRCGCWQVGEHLAEDKIVAVIDTCKASVEARCRASGVVKEVLVSEGEEVWELQPLVVITCDEGIEGKILNW